MIKPDLGTHAVINDNVDLFAITLRQNIDTLLVKPSDRPRRTITVDLRNFDYINEIGLSRLIAIRRQTHKNRQTDVKFIGLSSAVKKKIQDAGLAQEFGMSPEKA